jgi:hypothetical protein
MHKLLRDLRDASSGLVVQLTAQLLHVGWTLPVNPNPAAYRASLGTTVTYLGTSRSIAATVSWSSLSLM